MYENLLSIIYFRNVLSHVPTLVWRGAGLLIPYLELDLSQYGSSTNESDAPKVAFGGEIGLYVNHAKSSVESSESTSESDDQSSDESDDGSSKELSKF